MMLEERFLLAEERIRQIGGEDKGRMPEAFQEYFCFTADFLLLMTETYHYVAEGRIYLATLQELQERNRKLYEDILPEHYAESYGNPVCAVRKLGEEYGQLLSFLYAELRSLIVFAHEKDLEAMVIRMELYLEIYGSFLCSLEEEKKLPACGRIRETIYWFVSDYMKDAVRKRIRSMLFPEEDFAWSLLKGCDLNSPEYLYYFGEYITDAELKTFAHLQEMDGSKIRLLADTYTEGYRIGFEKAGKDLSKKKIVNIRYCLGFERMIGAAIDNFAALSLKPVIYRAAPGILQGKGMNRIGYHGAVPNRQYDFDHKDDQGLVLDKALVQVRLEALRDAYEEYKQEAALFAGPAVVEVFGEPVCSLCETKEAVHLSAAQQKLSVEYAAAAGEIQNRYIKGEERSFTIIALPTPEIGEDYEEIFEEVIRINTLDYRRYQEIQQRIIMVLDKGKYVLVKGCNGNKTNLRVMLHPLQDASKQTNFENCLADVNIPVGEVFTSPLLAGTEGILHVSRVFLNELEYRDLKLTFADGMVKDYSCSNFESEEENRKYIKDNVLFHHDSLPLGEFAIGTNTTAYAAARKYGIEQVLPILIAEKTGPHFALGDTCYSHEEDIAVFNPDGREIIARDNECSLKRKQDAAEAYFNCHTDITIPYEELGEISVVTGEEEVLPILIEGRFVLEGTEELNLPLEKPSSSGE